MDFKRIKARNRKNKTIEQKRKFRAAQHHSLYPFFGDQVLNNL